MALRQASAAATLAFLWLATSSCSGSNQTSEGTGGQPASDTTVTGATSTDGMSTSGTTTGATTTGATTTGATTTGATTTTSTGTGGAGTTGGSTTDGVSMGGSGSGIGGAGTDGSSTDGMSMGGTSTDGSSTDGTSTTGPLPPVYEEEDTGADCTVPTSFPSFGELPSIPEFPDPFLMEDGTRISSRADWRCRRAEIRAQIERWELGAKPPPTESEVSASFSGNTLTVNVQVGGQSIQLSTTINLPNSGTAPYPAVIRMAGSGVPISGPVASMNFSDGQLASQFPTRGQGPFWDLFPDSTVGAYAGWAWGVSRIIDGLEMTADQNQIDTKRLAVTGCSYAGKMALWAGAFDERIALTIPEESGGGGEASWRVMAGQPATENLEEAQGTGWYSENLLQFGNADAPKLPFDQHSLVAMVAPRAILAIQNTGIERLGSEAGGASMRAAAEVYRALGVPERIAFSQAVASGHCAFPNSQSAEVQAFVDKFLLGDESVDTNITKDSYNTDMSQWITWDTPTLQ